VMILSEDELKTLAGTDNWIVVNIVAQVSEEATLEAAREWLVGVCTRHKDRQGKPMNCIRWNCGWCRGDFERGEMPE